MKSPLETREKQRIRELCIYTAEELKKGLAHCPANRYKVRNESRDFLLELEQYMRFLEHEEKAND